MKKSLSDPPDSDRTRLSPTHADGDLLCPSQPSSRRPPVGDPSSVASLSESNLAQYQQLYEQLKDQHDKLVKEYNESKNPGNKDFGNNGNNGGPSVHKPASSVSSNTSSSSPGNNTTAAVSPASASTAPLQDAWPGPILEAAGGIGGGSGKEKEREASAPNFSTFSTSPARHPITNTSNHADVTAAANKANNATTPVDPTKDDFTAIEIGQTADNADSTAGTTTETATVSGGRKLWDFVVSFFITTKRILLHSWLNVFLVLVPAGIIVGALPGVPPSVVFSVNAIAIIPLAGLLGFATETVAHRMGDSIGALLNVTFGNAVELIIFIIALVKDEIRIVQASLLGSILANLLLILGMSFLLGGLRFREQIYNSTVTQMSACLLSLSVISLVLPTAFHASFKSTTQADQESLKISRGTSVILLLVYGIYLMFQLKSHAYMYESTPQHIIDEESTPGPAAGWLDSSSSDDSSSSSSDSDTSGHSRDTMKKRMRRVIRGGRRRKSSVASLDTSESIFAGTTRTPSFSTATAGAYDDTTPEDASASTRPSLFPRGTMADFNEEAIDEDDTVSRRHRKRHHKRSLRRYRRNRRKAHDQDMDDDTIPETAEGAPHVVTASGIAMPVLTSRNTRSGPVGPVFLTEPVNGATQKTGAAAVYAPGEPRRVDFAIADPNLNGSINVDEFGNPTGAAADLASARRAFNLRAMSLRPVAKSLAPTVFTQPVGAPPLEAASAGPIPRIRYGIHRTNSLPDPVNQPYQFRPPGAMLPSQIPAGGYRTKSAHVDENSDDLRATMSRKAAVLLLLVTTGLVAACAEFMVSSINGLVATSSVGEVFIGLIILPIVGNAAEHVTAVMVAMKNKMDLAIGVAVGSSIQIALFMTPLVVILGWIIGRDMTLYFTLFETVCLFVSAFIVNFLVLDGRSNYLEGALLCTTYVIISLVAFFYPKPEDASSWG